MFLDPKIDMLLCVRGGYGAIRTLPYINLSSIKKNPKIFLGFSDITVLLNTFYQKCNLITFHGPMLNSKFSEASINNLLQAIMDGYAPYIISSPSDLKTKSNCNSTVYGTLVGGNLSVLCSMLSTPYEISTDNKILLLEDVGEEPYKIDRFLTQLLLANKLQNCKAILLGQFTACTSSITDSFSVEEVIKERLFPLNLPVVYNFMSGHDTPNLTLPIGAFIRLNCSNGEIELLEAVVK
jgi:muramoyltetrapeptide carboxypeptidase